MLHGPLPAVRRARIEVTGLVQGVGFRPFVWRLAQAHEINGWVRNDGGGVTIEAEGADLSGFLAALRKEAPVLARVDEICVVDLPPLRDETGFTIESSAQGAPLATSIGADTAVCADCLDELFDSANRRARHPFITCTNCGPRFTITQALPYDRPQTSMAHFPMCAECAAEYASPADRRFHAEPIACPNCGPALSHDVADILRALQAGQVVALKGLGGYHLACDARNQSAVARLRSAKQRDAKPFAVMVANLESARRLALLDPVEADLLESAERPVVIVASQAHGLAADVTQGLPTLGLMLPVTPIQYLLFHEAADRPEGTAWLKEAQPLALVMTSANLSGDPLVRGDDEAHECLNGVADLIVSHDRAIVVRCDDSVLRVIGGAPHVLRRARGYTPQGIALGTAGPPVLALGAHLKTSVCVTRGAQAFLSQHIGDLETPATRAFHAEAAEHLLRILEVSPVLVAHDLHPDMASTQLAAEFGLPTLGVQHHHAHIAAVCAEHGVDLPVLGLALDGYGYGPQGEAWGGELLLLESAGFTTLGGLAPVMSPGGDKAAREPWRMAVALLEKLGRGREVSARFGQHALADRVHALVQTGTAPMTSSCGRLFDAAAALLGLCEVNRYEAEAALRLEAAASAPRALLGGWHISGGRVDFSPLFDAVCDAEARDGAALFHGTLAAGLAQLTLEAAQRTGLTTVALGGGCLANRLLNEALCRLLAAQGIRTFVPRHVPAGDGGLALGQAWVAQRHLASRT
jgi:hydrogenase maturation protein HypF